MAHPREEWLDSTDGAPELAWAIENSIEDLTQDSQEDWVKKWDANTQSYYLERGPSPEEKEFAEAYQAADQAAKDADKAAKKADRAAKKQAKKEAEEKRKQEEEQKKQDEERRTKARDKKRDQRAKEKEKDPEGVKRKAQFKIYNQNRKLKKIRAKITKRLHTKTRIQ